MSTTTKHHIPPWAKDESCLHNPDRLTPEQVGEDYRLLLPSEVTGKHEHVAHSWDKVSKIWDGPNGVFACFSSITYRVPLTVPWPQPPSEGPRTDEGVGELLCRMRAMGWMVAVHNDYRQNDKPHTFWLFTRGEACVKGEGEDDYTALMWAIGRAQTLADHAIAHHEASKEKEEMGIPTVDELVKIYLTKPNILHGITAVREAMLKANLEKGAQRELETLSKNLHDSEAHRLSISRSLQQRAESAEAQLASLKSHLVTAELERDRLQSWKDQMLTVESWWSKVDEFIRNHPKAPMGHNVSDIALQWLRAYMEEKDKP